MNARHETREKNIAFEVTHYDIDDLDRAVRSEQIRRRQREPHPPARTPAALGGALSYMVQGLSMRHIRQHLTGPCLAHRHALHSIATTLLFIWGLSCFYQTSQAQTPTDPTRPSTPQSPHLSPFANTQGTLNPAWQLSGIPGKKIAVSQFEPVVLAHEPALKLSSQHSYGVLTHTWHGAAPAELAWRWRVDQPVAQADITTKTGDDAAAKVCVMFKQPMADIPFLQRAALSLARAATGQDIPNATLCYIWDTKYPAGTSGHNPYTARVRYIVVNGTETPTGRWVSQSRPIAQDFARLFGSESATLPPVIAVAIGADSDNTHGSSVAYVAQLRWNP